MSDYTPPPELQAQHDFLVAMKRHFTWPAIAGAYAPAFSRRDLMALDEQSLPRGEECMRQLKETGVCVMQGLKAVNGDDVTVMFDRNCAISSRTGKINGHADFLMPPEIGKMLPRPVNPAPPLQCAREGSFLNNAPGPDSAPPSPRPSVYRRPGM